MDLSARQRMAEWANRPDIKKLWRSRCVGAATVVARPGARQGLSELLWLWTPAAEHDAVHTIPRGVDFCVTRLRERNVELAQPDSAFRTVVCRGLARASLAAGAHVRTYHRRASAGHRTGKLQTLTEGSGSIVLGWRAAGVLWSSFRGHLSASLGDLYAERLERLIWRVRGVTHFLDASGIESFDVGGLTTTLRILVAHRWRFSTLQLLNWPGGGGASHALLRALGETLQLIEERDLFEHRMASAMPEGCLARPVSILSHGTRRR